MLASLTRLEELGTVYTSDIRLWNQVRDMGGHNRLEKLVVNCSEPAVEATEAMVSVLMNKFQSLIELEIHFVLNRRLCSTKAAHILSELKRHPSLTTIKCAWLGDNDREEFFQGLREALGDGIQVVEIVNRMNDPKALQYYKG